MLKLFIIKLLIIICSLFFSCSEPEEKNFRYIPLPDERVQSEYDGQILENRADTVAGLSQTEKENKTMTDSLLNALLNAPKARKQHYYFAHAVLPALVHANPEKMLAILQSAEGDSYLLDLWNSIGKDIEDLEDEDLVTPEGLSYFIKNLDEQSQIVLVRLPAPEKRSEAYFIGLVFSPKRRSFMFWKTSIFVRYFTLEIGMGRTIIGEWTKRGHANYGDGPQPNEDEFIRAILNKTSMK